MLNLEVAFHIGHAAQSWTRAECAASPASHQASPASISHASLGTDPTVHIFSLLFRVVGVFFSSLWKVFSKKKMHSLLILCGISLENQIGFSAAAPEEPWLQGEAVFT